MCENLHISDKLTRVRDMLNSEKVQLWTPPYYIEGIGASESDLKTLAERYSPTLNLSLEHCLCALAELQTAALENLDSRNNFQNSGTATFKVKVPNGNVRVSAKLDDLGDVLIQQVAEKLNLPENRLQLIGKGKLLNGTETLISQGISNNQKFLVIVLEEEKERKDKENIHKRLQMAKDDAILLMKRENKYMTMEDQHGNAVHLPPDEQTALMLALAIHEKGKAALRRDHINEALFMFLEADQEFSHCRTGLLSTVDNYALLYLDIVWCYLKLRSADYLQDADRRLRVCEEQLVASYGPNMRRVEQIKGTSANERCLLMRLHLMQAIVLYHQNKREEARKKFIDVQWELLALKVDDASLRSLTEMGFTENEARLALREAKGVLSDAVTRIYTKRELRTKARKTAKKERKMAGAAKEGGTADGQWVNPKTLNTLVDMGYELVAARIALKEAKNDIEQALLLLTDIPALLQKCPPAASVPSTSSGNSEDQDRKLMERVLKLTSEVKLAVKVFNAIQKLPTERQGSFLEQAQQYEGKKEEIIAVLLESLSEQSTSAETASSSSSTEVASDTTNDEEIMALKIANKLIEEQSAYERFSEDISVEEEDHLDYPLVDEERFLLEYLSVLGI